MSATPKTLTTTLHAYSFDTHKPDDAAAYDALVARLKAQGLHVMESHGGAMHYMPDLDGVPVELETAHLFENQWNAAPIGSDSTPSGRRLFDWAQDYRPSGSRYRKQGHYLDQTPAMAAARRDTLACGYCGKQEPAHTRLAFCPHCIGSEYLKASELHLTRMLRVCDSGSGPHAVTREPLTEAERAELLPKYRDAQLHGNTERDKARIAKARADLRHEYERASENATAKRDGMLWLMDRGIRTDNVIYYTHTGRFGFGWRNPCDAEYVSALLDLISEFPFPYDITCDDGRKLSGD